jgi:hypothetical protein
VAQPARAIKLIQRWLIEKELDKLPLHEAAKAYRPGSKIRINAEAHANGAFLLKMDFANFFPSIGEADLRLHLSKYGQDRWNTLEIQAIARAVLWQPKGTRVMQLCVGGPSSPLISNSIMYDFDRDLMEICSSYGVVYTRYADDLAFSTSQPDVLHKVEKDVERLLSARAYPRLILNQDKTVHSSKAHLRRVTGLTITPDGKISIGRERKRSIRSKIHHFLEGKLSTEDAELLKGLLAFCLDAEPEYVARLTNAYGAPAIRQILGLKTQRKKSQKTPVSKGGN